jgi:hemoglobin
MTLNLTGLDGFCLMTSSSQTDKFNKSALKGVVMADSLYEKYGGFAGINGIVSSFYAKISDSDFLEPWFVNVDMKGLIDHQTQFLCMVLDGPSNYTGDSMEAVHFKLAVSREAFEEVVEFLEEALEEGGVDDDDVASIMEMVGGFANAIITIEE